MTESEKELGKSWGGRKGGLGKNSVRWGPDEKVRETQVLGTCPPEIKESSRRRTIGGKRHERWAVMEA